MTNMLIVDDELAVRTMISRILRRRVPDITIEESEGPKSAIERIQKEGIDILITDYQMPIEGDGIRLITSARSQEYTIPIILHTSIEDDKLLTEAKKLSATHVKKTQSDTQELINAVTQEIQKPRLTREEYKQWEQVDIPRYERIRKVITEHLTTIINSKPADQQIYATVIDQLVTQITQKYLSISLTQIPETFPIRRTITRGKMVITILSETWNTIKEKIEQGTFNGQNGDVHPLQQALEQLIILKKEYDDAGGPKYQRFKEVQPAIQYAKTKMKDL